jgi:hypothetical protein
MSKISVAPRRDHVTCAGRATAQVRRNDRCTLATDVHGGDAFVPALDDLALAEREGKRLTPVERTIKLLAFLAVDEQPAGIIDCHDLAGLRHQVSGRGLAPRLNHRDLTTRRFGTGAQIVI